MKNYGFSIVAVLIIILTLSVGCEKLFDHEDDLPQQPPYQSQQVSGVLNIPDGADIEENDLAINTFSTISYIDLDGSFSVNTPAAEKYQVMFFKSKLTGNTIFLGLLDPAIKKVHASDTSTALALLLFNPYLVYSDQMQRQEYLLIAQQNPKFIKLLTLLNDAYRDDPEMVLDYEKNPTIYQVLAELMKETLEDFNDNFKAGASTGSPPYIEDAPGEDIIFVNNRHVWYAAGIHPDAGEQSDVVSVERKKTLVSFQLGWPPVYMTEPKETYYSLGDGNYMIYLAKGLSFSKIFKWDDPEGRATLMNVGESILYLIEIIAGYVPSVSIMELPNHFHISSNRAAQLSVDIAQGDVQGFIGHFIGLLQDNAEGIAYWIYQEIESNARHEFIQSAAGILKKVSLVFELLGYVNEQGPFFWDLILAPKDVTYHIKQSNGVVTDVTQNIQPVASFTVNPPSGITGTVFQFDATGTTDDSDDFDLLQFRWDFKGDDNWTSWSSNHTIEYTYTESGSFNVILEVRDTGGLSGFKSHPLNVGGGAGTASHVKLFRDVYPWESNALVEALEDLGFIYGAGPDTYEIIGSDQMANVQLNPGEDLVIISNDQDQNFYNNYAANQVRFSNFVYMGGSMLWEACDMGWAEGSIAEAGIVLPGNLTMEEDYDSYNYLTDSNLPLTSGLPEAMDHNYASHEAFFDYPDGAMVYCANMDGEATLIEFNIGGGWVIITGQPLEHQYEHVYGNYDMEELLPRIISYFTGSTFRLDAPDKNKMKLSSVKTNVNNH